MPLHDRRPRRQTRRALLTRLTQVGLLAAGVELAAACDRLPGQAPRVPRIGWVANQNPAGDPVVTSTENIIGIYVGDPVGPDSHVGYIYNPQNASHVTGLPQLKVLVAASAWK